MWYCALLYEDLPVNPFHIVRKKEIVHTGTKKLLNIAFIGEFLLNTSWCSNYTRKQQRPLLWRYQDHYQHLFHELPMPYYMFRNYQCHCCMFRNCHVTHYCLFQELYWYDLNIIHKQQNTRWVEEPSWNYCYGRTSAYDEDNM